MERYYVEWIDIDNPNITHGMIVLGYGLVLLTNLLKRHDYKYEIKTISESII